MHLDRGYDSAKTRDLLEILGYDADIAAKGVPAPVQAGKRWPVERTHSWLNGYGKLRRCTDKRKIIVEFNLYLAVHNLLVPGSRTGRTSEPVAGVSPRRLYGRRGRYINTVQAKTLITVVDRAGAVARPPPVWAAAAALLAARGGTSGRRAALRGGACYAVAAVVTNVVMKPMADRRRPRKGRLRGKRPLTSSFPSGHAASDAAFCFGAAQELPWLILPLGAMAMLAHWSIVRSGQHHFTDVLAAGFVGAASAWSVARLWPPARG